MEKISASEMEGGVHEETSPAQTKLRNQRTRWGARAIGVVLGLSYLALWGPLKPDHLRSSVSKHRHGHGHDGGEGCPYQPDPLPPKLRWNVTDEEKAASVDHFSQAVVCPPSLSLLSIAKSELSNQRKRVKYADGSVEDPYAEL